MPSTTNTPRDAAREARDDSTALPAGNFGRWLRDARAAQRIRTTTDVACGTCNACCRSSYFIHIDPGETRALARIPKPLLFKAPGMPSGHLLMGYDEHGRCPMLVDGRCSIYEDRPQTCRDYDCRLFAATRTPAGGEDKRDINRQARRWRFEYDGPSDTAAAEALAAAASFLQRHASAFPPGFLPTHPTQLALVALEVYDLFEQSPGIDGAGLGGADTEGAGSAVEQVVRAVQSRWTALLAQRAARKAVAGAPNPGQRGARTKHPTQPQVKTATRPRKGRQVRE